MLRYSALALVMAAVASPAPAQMDWLTPHLDSQRYKNTMDAQRRAREKRRQQGHEGQQARQGPEAGEQRPVTLAERQAAWSRNKAEYRRRMLHEGPRAADRWLDQIVLAER